MTVRVGLSYDVSGRVLKDHFRRKIMILNEQLDELNRHRESVNKGVETRFTGEDTRYKLLIQAFTFRVEHTKDGDTYRLTEPELQHIGMLP